MDVFRPVGMQGHLQGEKIQSYRPNLFSPVMMITTGTVALDLLYAQWQCTDTAGHTKTFDHPVMDNWEKVKVL